MSICEANTARAATQVRCMRKQSFPLRFLREKNEGKDEGKEELSVFPVLDKHTRSHTNAP